MTATSALEEGSATGRPPVWDVLAEHFQADPSRLPVLSERFPSWDHVNVQAALDSFLAEPGRTGRSLGASVPAPSGGQLFPPEPPGLNAIMASPVARVGAVDHVDLPSGPDTTMSCIRTGLVLVSGPDGPLAVWIRLDSPYLGRKVSVEVKAPTVAAAQAFLDELRRRMDEANVFRGQVVRFTIDRRATVEAAFEARPDVVREDLVLPPAVLDAVDSHSVGIGRAAPELLAARRHLKRGLLLYGPPGTGKTLTTKYVLSRLPEATVFYLVGSSMGWLRFVAPMAAALAPSVVVLDDVDLVAEDRELGGMSPRRHLFDLLDAMDGVGQDADVLFICTTNRPEALEKAIAARPGRVDLAVEIATPDGDCRRRLLERYAAGLELAADLEPVVARTEGVTASFMKELLRRAAVEALRRSPDADPIRVDDEALSLALDSMLDPMASHRPRPTTTPAPGGAQ